ncbi:hypothetical protein D1007_13004 [Hordeum vulgare]|nr:hypothetical protein D1007_13004 [Hordeum vulgare]
MKSDKDWSATNRSRNIEDINIFNYIFDGMHLEVVPSIAKDNAHHDGDPSNIQSTLKEIASWSIQNNADDSDANKLEKLEKLLTDALRDTKSKKVHFNGSTDTCNQSCS